MKVLYGVQDTDKIGTTIVNIWGVNINYNESKDPLKGVNLLGADFLERANIKLEITYDSDFMQSYCVLKKWKVW